MRHVLAAMAQSNYFVDAHPRPAHRRAIGSRRRLARTAHDGTASQRSERTAGRVVA